VIPSWAAKETGAAHLPLAVGHATALDRVWAGVDDEP